MSECDLLRSMLCHAGWPCVCYSPCWWKRKFISDHSCCQTQPTAELLSCQFNLHKIISSFTYNFLKSKSGGSPQIVLGMMWLLLREAPSEGLVKVVVFSTHNHGCNYYWRWQEVSSRFYQKANFNPIHSAHL